ncbi:hypothetical protein SPBRAN_1343 [uncultured Candidatus Thioglobus sp.]|nr:hypothetical protein SPBRAN_1343 [uncultured Candidatus Thioglobus sp.]
MIDIEIRPSKIYLSLSISAYALSFSVAWYYFYNIWLSLGVSALLCVSLFRFLPKLRLTNANSITKITLNNDRLTIQKNDKSSKYYTQFYPSYQSRFLLIINIIKDSKKSKDSVVIFKDSLASQSLSQLNRYFNAKSRKHA